MKRLQTIGEWLLAQLVRLIFALLRALGPDRASNLGAWVTPRLGVWTRNHKHTMDNLRLAYPEKTEAERLEIAKEAWANLGRTACEYPHLEALFDVANGRVEADEDSKRRFEEIRVSGKPVLVFAAHLANWELPAVAAFKLGQPAAILYRTPNNRFIAADIVAMREPIMGQLIPAGIAAPIRMADALDRGLTLGMLIDQRFGRGPRVPFFGHPVAANPFLARLARRFGTPVHGLRAVRLPGNRFRLELTPALDLPRDAKGQVDVEASTAMVNGIIEGWVREHPGQWLWMHRRWR
ncbi:lipid A biosynthesis lauroyl acyltransferase [Roseococcus sp. YIM B11640]|uniref:lipid A biosynthesis lauroyl acyltransferase n=1 Tax=Roseococcus sp. YIM B11640 TaxID=3133973 RepID=UPI003C7E7002